MLINSMGLILADHKRIDLAEITDPRALAAVPFAGRYRLIDFMLSNMVNSGIKNVAVLALKKYKSLMDHLGTGLFWDLDRMQQGLTIIPPFYTSGAIGGSEGDLTGLYEFVMQGREKYVVISNGNLILNIDLEPFVEEHAKSDADISVLYKMDADKVSSPNYGLVLDNGYVCDLYVDSREPKTQACALGIVIIERELLIKLISEAMAHGSEGFSLERLLKKYREFRIKALEYPAICLRINSLASFYDAHMQILNDDIRAHIFQQETRPIYTKIKNEAPAYYDQDSFVSNSIVSDGCNIYGSLSNCVLFRGVHVGKHANLHNCIIFQDSYIGEGADLNNVILDKNTNVQSGVKLQGVPAYPVVIRKGAKV